jgi:uncharacterized protein (DUF697 family)
VTGSESPPRRGRRRLYEPLHPEAAPVGPPPGADEPTPRPDPAARAPSGKEADAERIVKKYVYWSTGLSLLPIPVVGVVSVLGVQLRMLSELSRLYGVPFSKNLGKALIASLGGGLGTMAVGRPIVGHALASLLPGAWPVLLAVASTASASTYAIGRVFTHHFELGGTLLSFRPEETRAFFEAQIREGAAPGSRGGSPAGEGPARA